MRTVLTDQSPVGMNGTYTVKFNIGTGTAKLQTRTSGGTFADITDTSKSASSSFNLTIAGEVQAVLTGDAVAEVEQVS